MAGRSSPCYRTGRRMAGGRLRAIDPEHLEAAASGGFRERLRSQPGGLLRIDRFFVSGVADDLARFLGEEARYRSEHRLYSAAHPVDHGSWTSADDRDRLSAVKRVANVEASSVLGRGTIGFVRVRSLLHSAEFRSFLETIASASLGNAWAVGACRLDAGDFIRPHRYDPGACRLRFEVFLSPRWEATFGAELCVVDKEERITRVPALFNRAAVLDTSMGSTYFVAPRRPRDVAVPRLSLEARYTPG